MPIEESIIWAFLYSMYSRRTLSVSGPPDCSIRITRSDEFPLQEYTERMMKNSVTDRWFGISSVALTCLENDNLINMLSHFLPIIQGKQRAFLSDIRALRSVNVTISWSKNVNFQ
ncbi:uncharacterized protein LOC129749703 [Uranotaenia lowii]|uniref:uncharacterized protein LOC129749701 n=1 Tax=Uranotaenia lowii TaxID=190385 RepID=UPI002478C319|nr:uncharacterized protein LOC129749701 [Uranotaenia lowii]XP_055600726.1 uncharacterized protein LOC129749703 [Uranotaenia lowii]